MRLSLILLFTLPLAGNGALIEMARKSPGSPEFRDGLEKLLTGPEGRKEAAAISEGPHYLTVARSEKMPALYIDDEAHGKMTRVRGTNLWFQTGQLSVGRSHAFEYRVDGKPLGPRMDAPFYTPDSYEQPGVPRGTLSEKFVHTSTIYGGARSEYWVYTPAQYDAATPAALMVWQDGHTLAVREGSTRLQIAIDNLTHQKKIPVAVYVFLSPGMKGEQRMRSVQYDTLDDTYARFLRDEILAEVASRWNLRRDGYSRGIAGESSGGICAFNLAWHQPDQFSRVMSFIGSYTSIQWRPGDIDGGNVYPFKVRKEPKRNIRVWLEDGSEDLENRHGSWPLQNVQMANSLKLAGYDFHFRFGNAQHNKTNWSSHLPEALAWLWRGYDPAKTFEEYQQDAAERDKPYFRVKIYNR